MSLITTLLLALALAAPVPRVTDPVAIFVTWDGDPTTVVSVDWHLEAGDVLDAIEIRGPGIKAWRKETGISVAFPHSTRTVRRTRITGLKPDGLYELKIGSRTYRYRTMPRRLSRPVVFATGGDTQSDDKRFGTTNRMVAEHNLDFILIGGDLAYSNGDPRLVQREQEWYETVTQSLVMRDGRLIPVIAAIGNHEVFSNRDTTEAFRRMIDSTGVQRGKATYYRVLHAYARDPQYRAIDIGNYLTLLILNTDHTAPVAGPQTEWLASVLQARPRVPHVFPVYHVPGYPSVRAFSGTTSARVREHWSPLFELAGIRLSFENHDHAYKRSVPLKAGLRDSTGVIYMGDGAWGAGPRVIGRDNTGKPEWYLEKYESVNHAIIVTLTPSAAALKAVSSDGVLIDSLTVGSRHGLVMRGRQRARGRN